MSIDLEYALANKDKPAVLCCRAEEGTVIDEHRLEDPAIFPDLIDTGLLNVDGALKIGQCLGATLTKTCDSLTPLTAEILTGIKEEESEEVTAEDEAPVVEEMTLPAGTQVTTVGGMVSLYIEEGKEIRIEFPV
ncbi:MAG TPA: sugar transporter [Mogibacterium sp.]|nr:sugar transporter [Mogibacterium sp.]